MITCTRCGGYIPDIGGHDCPAYRLPYIYTSPSNLPIPKQVNNVIKCGMCGSTTIDHTEKDCKMNRGIYLSNPGGRTTKRKSNNEIPKLKKRGR